MGSKDRAKLMNGSARVAGRILTREECRFWAWYWMVRKRLFLAWAERAACECAIVLWDSDAPDPTD